MNPLTTFISTAMLLSVPILSVSAKVELAGLFVDHMVVQRERPIPVWGSANSGEAVTARLAGQEKKVNGDEKGL